MQNQIDTIVSNVLKNLKCKRLVPIEVSARHVHLSQEHIKLLFGNDYELKVKKPLSQKGQFQYEERVNIIGPKGIIKDVAILGPPRDRTQVEISKTDTITLGIDAPLRESGDLDSASSIIIANKNNIIKIDNCVIVAKRHIHMSQEDAIEFDVRDKQIVSVEILSDRKLIFEDVLVRVNKNYTLSMHIDFDEANACLCKEGVYGRIII